MVKIKVGDWVTRKKDKATHLLLGKLQVRKLDGPYIYFVGMNSTIDWETKNFDLVTREYNSSLEKEIFELEEIGYRNG